MCNCNIIEGQGTSSSCNSLSSACNTITTDCKTAEAVNNTITKINSKIDNMDYLKKAVAQNFINALPGYSDIQSNLSTIIDFCKTSENACSEITNIENIINLDQVDNTIDGLKDHLTGIGINIDSDN